MDSSNQTEWKPMSEELRQIEAEARALDEQSAPAVTDEPPADFYVDAKGIIDLTAESLEAIYPSTGKVLDKDRREKLATALTPVLEKYGLSLGVIFGRWGAEIGAAFAFAQVAIPLSKAISADRAAARAEKDGTPPPQKPISEVGLTPVIDRADPKGLHNRV